MAEVAISREPESLGLPTMASSSSSPSSSPPPSLVEVVVSRFSEDIKPLLGFIHKKHPTWTVVVYNKNSTNLSDELLAIEKRKLPHLHALVRKHQLFKVVDLPNVGRESHTFLYHITQSLDNLAMVTVFLPGSCMNSDKMHHTEVLLGKVDKSKTSVLKGSWYAPDVRSQLKSFCINAW